jgi:hypothetical protein
MLRLDESFGIETHLTTGEILGHPDFPAARAAFVDSILGLYEYDAFVSRLVVEAGRSVMFIVIICLYARYVPEIASTWPTISRLKSAMTRYGLAGPRRIDDLVRRLSDTEFIKMEASPVDGRARLLTPSNMTLELDADWLVANYSPLKILYPESGHRSPPTAGTIRYPEVASAKPSCSRRRSDPTRSPTSHRVWPALAPTSSRSPALPSTTASLNSSQTPPSATAGL